MKWLLNPSSCPGFQKFEIKDHVERGEHVHHTEYFFVQIPERYALVNITDYVEDSLSRAKIADGFCFVSAMHITAGIYVNDAENGLLSDISKWIDNLAPFGEDYRHHATGEDNADAHLKSFLTNHCIQVPITKGKLDLGTWQQIFYGEYDGKRTKRILIKFTGLKIL